MSSSHDSDISSFAEWEAQESLGSTIAERISEREQKLRDMTDPARVWKDRDSSNDARSSEGESASGGEVGTQNGKVVKKRKRMEIPSSTQGTESQGLSQNQDDDAPTSSQPRPESSDNEDSELSMEAINDTLLPLAVSSLTADDLLLFQASIQDFALEHPFWTQSNLEGEQSEEAASEFENDIFEYAREAGLSVHLAKVEVMRAMGAWKMERGLGVGEEETGEAIEGIFEKVLQTIGVVTEAIGGREGTKKRGREQKVMEKGPGDVVVESIEGQGGENKEPKAKRQRRREKKRKLEDEPASPADAMELSKDEEPKTKGPKRQRSRRKLGEEVAHTSEVLQPAGVVSESLEAVTADNEPAGQNITKIPDGKMKLAVNKDLASKQDSTATPATQSKSAKRIRNEKKKEKKKRAKLGPTTSSHFAKPETSNPSKAEGVSPKDKIVATQAQTEDTQMSDVPGKENQTSVDHQNLPKEDIEQVESAGKDDQKKKRKKKRNKNRLSEVESGEAVKAAEGRSARKIDREAMPKDVKVVADDSEQPAKKKRVRSRIMKDSGDEVKALESTNVLEPEVEPPVEPVKSSKTTVFDPDVPPSESKTSKKSKSTKAATGGSEINKVAEDELLVRPLRTFDTNGVFGTPDASNLDLPQIAIEVAAIEQTPSKEKSRKRKKKSEIESAVDAKVVPTQVEVTNSTESEPPKKKSRDRKRKSLSKLQNNSTKDIEVPATEALIELPDANSEKKKHKREKSSKRSSVGTEVKDQVSEASNSRHS